MSSGKWSSSFPSATSSAACAIAAARLVSSKPKSWFAFAAAHLIKPTARMNGRENRNRLPESSKPHDVWTRRGEHPRARSSRPSNPFRFGSVFLSCRTLCADAGEARTAFRFRYPTTVLCRRYFVKHGDKHRRDILQKIFRFVALENSGVLPQLI